MLNPLAAEGTTDALKTVPVSFLVRKLPDEMEKVSSNGSTRPRVISCPLKSAWLQSAWL
jgi:hypothetical protein